LKPDAVVNNQCSPRQIISLRALSFDSAQDLFVAFKMNAFLLILAITLSVVSASLQVAQNESTITLSNGRLAAVWQKSVGQIIDLTLGGQDLLGPQSGSTGIGPYLDCYCIPSGFYTAGATTPTMQVVQGVDSTGTSYAGVILNDTYTPTGQQFQQYWFLRDGETGLHMFSRLSYYNETTPFLRNLQELRTLFRPNTDLWTHLTSSEIQTAPLPSTEAIKEEVVVQDATWTFNNTPSDAYYTQFSDYFTKYTFSNRMCLLKSTISLFIESFGASCHANRIQLGGTIAFTDSTPMVRLHPEQLTGRGS
jgi:rhamnogalacturonan endolyase